MIISVNAQSSSIRGSGRRISDGILLGLIDLSAALVLSILIGIIGFVLVRGFSSVTPAFLFGVTSALKQTTGIAGNIVNTLYIIVITLVFAAPIGVGSAVYLNEYAKPGKLVQAVEFTTQTLAGIPSILFGLFGMVFFGIGMKLGYSILAGSLTLALMVLPLITRNTQEALKAVPESCRTGALALGSGKWHMIRTILLPAAKPGILAGLILAVGRIVGESAALLFTAGSGYFLPRAGLGWLRKVTESGGSLTVQMYLSMSKAQYATAYGIAAVLIVIVLCLNGLTKLITKKLK